MLKLNIGGNIRKYRQMAEISQAELGNLLSVSNQTISSWETNRTEPDICTLERMAEILKCKKSDLLNNSQNQIPQYSPEMQELIALYSKLNDAQKESVINTMKLFVQLNENH